DVARAQPAVPATAAAAAAAAQPDTVAPAASPAPTAPTVSVGANAPAAVAPTSRPSFHSLFSDNQGQPVSQFVRDLWTTNPRVAAALSGQSVAAAAPATPPNPAGTSGAPLDLFSDRPSDVKMLFGQRPQ